MLTNSAVPALVWFRQDLRIADNPALAAAVKYGPVVPVFVWDEAGEGRWKPGGASRVRLHGSLAALDSSLRARGSRLVLGRGDSATELARLARESGAAAVYWNRRYEPEAVAREPLLERRLTEAGLRVRTFKASLLFEPEELSNKQGGPYQVFSAFWRRVLEERIEAPSELEPAALRPPGRWPASLGLDRLGLLPRIGWHSGFQTEAGEEAALRRLARFLDGPASEYDRRRDWLGSDGTSGLSAALHWGEIGPRQAWAAVLAKGRGPGFDAFGRQLAWREFAHHLLGRFPHTAERPLRPEFDRFEWAGDPDGARWKAWTRGLTGFPVVDAGMRELWSTGLMHNRARMIAASFLVKDLRIPWTGGARWFWDTLLDADLANNTLGWQWSAGCGADAAPYFRIFSPVLQGRKFDASGAYVRKWVPELARLPDSHLHSPWDAPESVLVGAGIVLGRDYPRPIVDHARARLEALAAFKALRG